MPKTLQRPSFEGMIDILSSRVQALERTESLAGSALREGRLVVQDGTGADRIRLGKLPDGTYGLQIISGLITLTNEIVGATYQPQSGEDAVQGDRTLATYGDLGGGAAVGPSVTVPVSSNGRLLVVAGAVLIMFNQTTGYGRLGYTMSGSNTLAAADTRSALGQFVAATNTTVGATLAVTRLHLGLAAGNTTLTAKYRGDGTNIGNFAERFIFAIPL